MKGRRHMDIGILALGTLGAVTSGWWFVRSVRATIVEEDLLSTYPTYQSQLVKPRASRIVVFGERQHQSSTR